MSFKTAIENFETAAQIAETADDSYREHLALGLIELAKSLQESLQRVEGQLSVVNGKISGLRT